MRERANIVYEAELKPDSRADVREGLIAFNHSQNPDYPKPLDVGLLLKSPQTGRTEGGLTARIGLGWMYVELLFVPEALRGRGLGRQLMLEAEAVALQHGCIGIWLDTFTFQAPGFYEKLGYAVFGEIVDFPPGQSRYFLSKRLS